MLLYAYEPWRDFSTALCRTKSSSSFWPTTQKVPRSESVQDVTGNYRPYDRHRPLWLSEKYERPLRYRNPGPYKFERNKQMAEHYWRDQYYFTSPLYNRTSIPHRPFQSEYGSHIYTYWARYNGYGYDRNHPAFYRRYFNPIDDYFG
uniref:Uncharacterized protein n=1 Tax=Meloidogyne incognita TaxID=6306 RepID=A0A914M3W4_MELIC